jgi:light-regulated signal transduction histidine kinase (bacteriophytochrome)
MQGQAKAAGNWRIAKTVGRPLRDGAPFGVASGPTSGVCFGAGADDLCVPLNSDALHELVGPVNQMRSMADLILKKHRTQLDGDTEALYGFMQDSSDRLQNLLNGLRTYMRILGQPAAHRHFDGNAILSGALATVQQSIDRTDAGVTHDPIPQLFGDPSQICCLFASLIENAIKFRGERRPEIQVGVMEEEDGWLFSVCDNGIGIDPRHHERIFGVFKRIHNEQYPGAGMGLAIARRIVERHGGRIWVESHLGQGSTFWFGLGNESS